MADWNSIRLKQAYMLIEAERAEQAQPPESGIDEALRAALDAVEWADTECCHDPVTIAKEPQHD